MARRRYYRFKRVYPKQKWLPVNNEVGLNAIESIASQQFITTIQPITESPSRTISDGGGNTSSATIIKIGRIKFKGVLQSYTSGGPGISYIIGVSYIPEGYTINQTATAIGSLGTSFFYKHPEWIMCWTRMDYTNGSQNNEFSLSSRLKRNLNTGDQIVVFRICINAGGNSSVVTALRGTISYVCRAN